jgi:hypothetical protein
VELVEQILKAEVVRIYRLRVSLEDLVPPPLSSPVYPIHADTENGDDEGRQRSREHRSRA